MGTLKVDNIQKEDGTAILTDGVFPTTILRSSSVGMVFTISVIRSLSRSASGNGFLQMVTVFKQA